MSEIRDCTEEASEVARSLLKRLRHVIRKYGDPSGDLEAACAAAALLGKKLNRLRHLVRKTAAVQVKITKVGPFFPKRGGIAEVTRLIVAKHMQERFTTGDVCACAVKRYGISRTRDLDKVRLALYWMERKGYLQRVGIAKQHGITWEIIKGRVHDNNRVPQQSGTQSQGCCVDA
jgi:hypothetical protein